MARLLASLALLLCASAETQAHPGFAAADLSHGFGHPFMGADHLLAMLAVGLWAARLGGRAFWAVPAAFLAAVALGLLTGAMHLPLPLVQPGIAGSVVVLGFLLALAPRLPLALACPSVGLFAVWHGHAHGTGLSLDAGGAGIAAGFLAATAALLALGLGLGLAGRASPRLLARIGWLIGLGGVALAAS